MGQNLSEALNKRLAHDAIGAPCGEPVHSHIVDRLLGES